MGKLVRIEELHSFERMRDVRPGEITDALRSAVIRLHEADDIENFLRTILSDRAATPHGPAEIADILTSRISVEDSDGLAAFVLKGRSFPTVRPKHVSHQLYRLEKIAGLHYAVLGATGIVLDEVKEQFISICTRLNVWYSLLDADDFARMFWAYGFLCPRDGSRIVGGRCHCGYAPEYSVLNILQAETLNELKSTHELGQRKALVVLPPGVGKTRIAAKDAKSFKAKCVLYVGHTNEILDVAHSEFSAAFGADRVCRFTSKTDKLSCSVYLTTIQYIEKNIGRLDDIQIDYLVIDEFHHAAAPTYRKVESRLKYNFLLGLTATPFRGDRQDISIICDGNVVVNYELRSGVEAGILTPYHYYGCFDDIDYGKLPIVAGGYSVRDLERKLIIKERHQAIVKKWREKAKDKPTLAFCCSHKHAEKLSDEFNAQRIPSSVYLSSTPTKIRTDLIKKLRTGKIKILCVVDVLNEGADIPFIECLLFVRPTESKRIFLQQLGRGLRRYVGKTHVVVVDFIGNFRNAYKLVEYHGLRPEEEDIYSPIPDHNRTIREVLDLPLGCKVSFEDRVLEIFAHQSLDPKHATRQNIGRILIYQYERLSRTLKRAATKKDVDRYSLLGSQFYRRIFRSWDSFQALIKKNSVV